LTFFSGPDLPGRFWILPVLLVVTWTGLWWGSRRARLWFAGLAPPVAVAVILLGVIEGLSSSPSSSQPPADLHVRIDAMGTGPGMLMVAIGLCTLVVAIGLTVVTFVVETTLMVRRHERAEREAAAAMQPPS
jgi:hypothetical protein